MYQRDRGELDWDARSIASTAVFNDGASTLQHSKSNYYAASETTLVQSKLRERYLVHGPGSVGHQSEIEMTPIDTPQEPLLNRPYNGYYQQGATSQISLPPGAPPQSYSQDWGNGRETPVHRPQERSHTPMDGYADRQSYLEYPPQQPFYQQGYPPQQRSYTPQPQHSPQAQYTHQQRPSHGQQLNQFTYPQQEQEGQHHSQQTSNATNLAGQGAYRGGY